VIRPMKLKLLSDIDLLAPDLRATLEPTTDFNKSELQEYCLIGLVFARKLFFRFNTVSGRSRKSPQNHMCKAPLRCKCFWRYSALQSILSNSRFLSSSGYLFIAVTVVLV
jgi:hypothetical protein